MNKPKIENWFPNRIDTQIRIKHSIILVAFLLITSLPFYFIRNLDSILYFRLSDLFGVQGGRFISHSITLFSVLFVALLNKGIRKEILQVNTQKLKAALLIFTLSTIVILGARYILYKYFGLWFALYENDTNMYVQKFIRLIFIGFAEELLFVLFIFVPLYNLSESKILRFVCIIGVSFFFAISHLDFRPEFLLLASTFRFLTFLNYLKLKNLPLLIGLHIIADIPIVVFHIDPLKTYFLTAAIVVLFLVTIIPFKRLLSYNSKLAYGFSVELLSLCILTLILLNVNKSSYQLYLFGSNCYGYGDKEHAIMYLDRAMNDEINKDKPNEKHLSLIAFKQGQIKFESKEYKLAYIHFKYVDSLNPSDKVVSKYLAESCFKMDSFHKANSFFLKLDLNENSNDSILYMAGLSSFYTSEYDRASDLFSILYHKDTSVKENAYLGRAYYELKKTTLSSYYFEEALKLKEYDEILPWYLCDSYRSSLQCDKMFSLIDDLELLKNENIGPLYHMPMAKCYNQNNEYELAKQSFKLLAKSGRIYDLKDWLNNQIGITLLNQDSIEEACEYFLRASKNDFSEADSLYSIYCHSSLN